MRRRAHAVLLVALTAVGCAHVRRAPLSGEIRAQLGRTGIAVASSKGGVDHPAQPTGWIEGTAAGVGRGFVTLPVAALTVVAHAGPYTYWGAGLAVGIGAALGVILFPVSVLGGAITAESTEATQKANQSIDLACRDLRPGATAGQEISRVYALKTGKNLPSDSLDSILEVDAAIELRGHHWLTGNLWTVNPERQLVVILKTRLVRVKNREILDDRRFEWICSEKPRTFVEWGQVASAIPDWVHQGVGVLALEAVDDLFVALPKETLIPAQPPRRHTPWR